MFRRLKLAARALPVQPYSMYHTVIAPQTGCELPEAVTVLNILINVLVQKQSSSFVVVSCDARLGIGFCHGSPQTLEECN